MRYGALLLTMQYNYTILQIILVQFLRLSEHPKYGEAVGLCQIKYAIVRLANSE